MKIKFITSFILVCLILSSIAPLIIADNDRNYPSTSDIIIQEIKEITDKSKTIDKLIGNLQVKYFEHIINDVKIIGDFILIHENPASSSIIKYLITWSDVDFEMPVFSDIEPNDFYSKEKIIFLEQDDLNNFYTFDTAVDFPVACWEVSYFDGTIVLYDVDGNKIGSGISSPSEAFLMTGPNYGEDDWGSFRGLKLILGISVGLIHILVFSILIHRLRFLLKLVILMLNYSMRLLMVIANLLEHIQVHIIPLQK